MIGVMVAILIVSLLLNIDMFTSLIRQMKMSEKVHAEIINNELTVFKNKIESKISNMAEPNIDVKTQGISLKNLDLKQITWAEQFDKIAEEDEEFEESIFYGTSSDKIEEFWDTVQSRLGLLQMDGINSNEVMNGYYKHLEKIKNRPRNK